MRPLRVARGDSQELSSAVAAARRLGRGEPLASGSSRALLVSREVAASSLSRARRVCRTSRGQ